MVFIRDLAPYNYYRGAPEALAVGWLDSGHSFSTGGCPEDVRDRVAELCATPVRLMRGYHYCQFCDATAEAPQLRRLDNSLHGMPDVARGNGEGWVTALDGTHFAAPVLLLHYIDEHRYIPPSPFIEAVRSGSPTVGID